MQAQVVQPQAAPPPQPIIIPAYFGTNGMYVADQFLTREKARELWGCGPSTFAIVVIVKLNNLHYIFLTLEHVEQLCLLFMLCE